jgi:alpha/beta superfamily hydrolase
MDNKVVFTLARALRERGLHVLRFNFRGAGGSDGVHDDGRGEVEDVHAALDVAAGLVGAGDEAAAPGSLLIAGFSFGSYVGLSAGVDDPRVGAFLAVAPPVNYYDYPETGDFGVPLGVIWAADDELVPARLVESWASYCPGADVQTHRIDGSTHLFHAHLGPLRRAVDAFLDHVARESAAQ